MAPMIDVQGLSKSYGSKLGITDVTFQVEEGDVFGFLGPNGAGKTTTIRLLMALLHADAGSARIAGLDCWKQSLEIKRLIGYMPGEPALDPNPPGGRRCGLPQTTHGAFRARHQPQIPPVLDRQQAQGRVDPSLHAPATPLDPRRADQRPRSTQPAGIRSDGARGAQ